MSAQSVTGTGPGSSGKFTTDQLAQIANGPGILISGRVVLDNDALPLSPPTPSANVYFPRPLPGSGDNYVIMITSMNAGNVSVFATHDDDDGNFDRFSVIGENEGTVMYMISKSGMRTIIV